MNVNHEKPAEGKGMINQGFDMLTSLSRIQSLLSTNFLSRKTCEDDTSWFHWHTLPTFSFHSEFLLQQTTEDQFKPNVIFIRLFLYKKHWSQKINKNEHASIYSMARDRKRKKPGPGPRLYSKDIN